MVNIAKTIQLQLKVIITMFDKCLLHQPRLMLTHNHEEAVIQKLLFYMNVFGRLVFLIYKNAEWNRRSRQERKSTRINRTRV